MPTLFRVLLLACLVAAPLPIPQADAALAACRDGRLARRGATGVGRLAPSCAARDGESRPTRVLAFSHTTGFRHGSIADAKEVLGSLPARSGITVELTEDASAFTDENLSGFDVVAFVNTTGDVLNDAQQAAMERFIRAGHGYVGVHSAADTEYDWPWYGRLVGAYFQSHPALPVEVEVTTEDPHHPSTAHLAETFLFTDEIYNFDRNPRPDHQILLTIDEEGFIYPNTNNLPNMGDDHPIAWHKQFDGGRSFYTNLGHRPETWRDPLFVEHLLAGIRWAGRADEYSVALLTGKARNPMELEVAPDGRVVFIERTGEVRVWSPRSGQVIESGRLDVDTAAENGLLGLALSPDFARTGHVFLYFSPPIVDPPADGPPGVNRLARFTMRADSTLNLSSRTDLLAVPSERECCHEGGSLAFAPDGTLFIGVGDNTDPFGDADGFAPLDTREGRHRFDSRRTAANPNDLRGKILRIRPDGSIPPGNMFPADGSAGRPEVFVLGTRNPFRLAVDPRTGRLFWGDVGPDAVADGPRGPRGFDEINFADRPGDYGWPFCIGENAAYSSYDYETAEAGAPFDCSGRIPAVLAYDYLTVTELALGRAFGPEETEVSGRTAIAGIFNSAPGPRAAFALPERYENTLLMTEWTRNQLASVRVSADGQLESVQRLLPWEPFARPIDLDVGPDGAVYVLEYGREFGGDNPDAAIRRIEYSASGELSPVAVIRASRTSAPIAPAAIRFWATDSRAPGAGDEIAGYEWDFDGDGITDSRSAIAEHTFTSGGLFPVTLRVSGTSGRKSLPTVVDVNIGNSVPEVSILEPNDGTTVEAGSFVEVEGLVIDPEDGEADCARYVWDIRLGHNSHTHPIQSFTGCSGRFRADLPAGHAQLGQRLFYVVELSYTDGEGPGSLTSLTGRALIRLELISSDES